MPSPISGHATGLYPIFHHNSPRLSEHQKKSVTIFNIVLGITTLGIGHAILGIIYLIQKNCAKTEKINQVAQETLNPNTARLVDQVYNQFKDLVLASLCFLAKQEIVEDAPYVVDIEIGDATIRIHPKFDEEKLESFLQVQKPYLSNQDEYNLNVTLTGKKTKFGPNIVIDARLSVRNNKVIGIVGPTKSYSRNYKVENYL